MGLLLAPLAMACNEDSDVITSVVLPDSAEAVECEGQYCNARDLQRFRLSSFYQKVTVVRQTAVTGSHRVSDAAIEAAAEIVDTMLAGDERIWPMLVEAEAHVAVIAVEEATTDIPEHRFLKDDPNVNWDTRARGFGGTPEIPVTSTGEENLLCLDGDRWAGESILVHEFAHTLHLIAINGFDPGFDAELDSLLTLARDEGLWANTYANTDIREYFAEGVQSWFNANQDPQPLIHNEIDTRDELREYDPRLHDLIGRYFVDTGWQPTCPSG